VFHTTRLRRKIH